MYILRAAENNVSFTVNTRDIEIKVDPSFVGDTTPARIQNQKKERGRR
jgi:hypothetical protein